MSVGKVQHWWAQLDFLAPDVRQAFGRLLAQLQRGLSTSGSWSAPEDPAGWSGLAAKGPWDRLLASEWALVDAAPDEFLRRACQGELAFWELEHEAQLQKRSVWVWLDVGPDQLGACRVVQIAMLLWLQQICLASGGEFFWGTVQSPHKGYDKLHADELKIYLAARSTEPVIRAPDDLDGIQTWCIGAANWVSSLPDRYQRVALTQEGLETVALEHNQRRLNLLMPPPTLAGRMLRDPTVWLGATFSQAYRGSRPAGSMVFSSCGRKLMLVGEREVIVVPMPSSINEAPGRAKVYPLRWDGPVLALSMVGKAIFLTQLQDDHWICYRLNPATTDCGEVRVPALKLAPFSIGHCWPFANSWRLWLGDSLFTLTDGAARLLHTTRGGLFSGRSGLLATFSTILDFTDKTLYAFDQTSVRRIHLAKGGGRLGMTCLAEHVLAEELTDSEWRLHWNDGSGQVKVSGSVIGVVADLHRGEVALLVQKDGWLGLVSTSQEERLDLGEPIAECTLHPEGLLAFRTRTGQMACYGLFDRRPRWLGTL